MPLSQKQLEILRRKCDAEAVAIDLDLMSTWTSQEAMQYFVSGGEKTPTSVREDERHMVERLPETEAYDQQSSVCQTTAKPSAEVSSDEEDDTGGQPQHCGIFAPTLLEHQSEEEQAWRQAWERRAGVSSSAPRLR